MERETYQKISDDIMVAVTGLKQICEGASAGQLAGTGEAMAA